MVSWGKSILDQGTSLCKGPGTLLCCCASGTVKSMTSPCHPFLQALHLSLLVLANSAFTCHQFCFSEFVLTECICVSNVLISVTNLIPFN